MSLPAWLLAPVLLALSRLLPADGVGLGLRLGRATACLLLPGALVARVLGVGGFAGALAWSMAALFGATAVMFAVHCSLWLALALLGAVALVALPFAVRAERLASHWTLGVLALGIVAGVTLWWVSRYDGDAFFHLGRVQKLLAFDSLSLRSVDEFHDGGLHPGYAFPLWHAAVALVARLAGVGAPSTVLHLPTVLLPLSFVLVYEAGTTLFASRWAIAAALGAIAVPAALVVAWLLPLVRETAAHNPSASELRRAFAGYGEELDVFGLHSYRLTPELFGRAGAIAVAALALLPLAVVAHRRMWGAFVLGAMVATLAIALLTFVFPHFADAISISQARRIIAFSPRPFVLVGGALVLAGFLRWAVLPVALAAGIALQLAYPGDFGTPYRFVHGGPALLTWIAFGAALAALLAAIVGRRRIPELEGPGPLAAAAVAIFLVPVAVHGYSHWTRSESARLGLPHKLVAAVKAKVPAGDVVFSDPLTAYELAAFAPVYINAAPTSHVADTRANRPTERVQVANRFFFRRGPLSVPRRYGELWLLVDRTRVRHADFDLPRVYRGSRYVLYRIPA